MVYFNFPLELTEEELMLQAKYAKLKKKKKQLAALKAPKPSESEKTYKKVMEAKDSKEVAKKLIRTGTLQAIQKSVEKTEKSKGFKRSQGWERKLSDPRVLSSYQPFSATHGPGGGFDTGADDLNPEPPIPPPPKKVKDLYESFVSARDREERKGDKAKSANTVYVHGFSVSEELLRNTFSSVGKIVNISMEIDKNCGFITFDKEDSAERAISDYHETSVKGVQLKVSKARRQIIVDPINDASSSATWSSIAASHSQKSSHNDKRNLIRYDEDLF
ncbi:negative elongation factor E-like [Lepeophtheirus salmonis]|uniref:negative elongation factor E-like n=1 Tax=Lepeophtheirus salmonis TaxID=72036 RepID=UPI001AEA2219|nr:negative elongation factor E-like [Lepeophtheirus salmonis]